MQTGKVSQLEEVGLWIGKECL